MTTYTGKHVRCTTAVNTTFDTVARSEPFLNTGFTFSRKAEPWMVIAVDHPSYDHPVHWPAEDVELIEVAPSS